MWGVSSAWRAWPPSGAWLLRDACAERRRPLGPGSQSFLSAAKAGIGGLAATSLAEPAPCPAPGSPFSSPPVPVSRGPGALPRRSPSPRAVAVSVPRGGVVGAHHCAPRPRGLHGRILWPRGLGARRRERVVGSGPCPGVAPWSRVKRTVSKRARLGWFVPAPLGPLGRRRHTHASGEQRFIPGQKSGPRRRDGCARCSRAGVPAQGSRGSRGSGISAKALRSRRRRSRGIPEAHPRFCHSQAGPRASHPLNHALTGTETRRNNPRSFLRERRFPNFPGAKLGGHFSFSLGFKGQG